MKILVIDDNEQDLKISRRYLEQAGFADLCFAGSGEDGVAKASAEKPDVVITDTNLTGIDGFQTCRQIKADSGGRIKVVIMTGYVDAVDAEKARENGADDYCVKTADFSHMIEALRRLIEDRV